GVFLTNTKTRRAKLTPDKLAALAERGLDWARGSCEDDCPAKRRNRALGHPAQGPASSGAG
ncbi:hypothetical protein, partial [Streptomyces sp. NPDC093589]|uniref:hypothetical protein n=1 Tax=Streptomyces sp. NPDC093589 TaxID=3366043 RepID=UPI0037F45019